jgi:chorismate mutase
MSERSGADRLWGVRGAVQADRNDAESILAATEELLGELIQRNGLTPESVVSCVFTCTQDLNAEFPAVAARRLGFDQVPLICAQEMDVPGAMERVIRVMVTYYSSADHTPFHTYLREAQTLRADLHSAQ